MECPEIYRKEGEFRQEAGRFEIPHYKIANYFFFILASSGIGWDHVSVSLRKKDDNSKVVPVDRSPTWEEMCFIKSQFWNDEEPVMQLHPPKSDWVNNHPHCLHLWKPQQLEIPLPPALAVGHKDFNTDTNTTK